MVSPSQIDGKVLFVSKHANGFDIFSKSYFCYQTFCQLSSGNGSGGEEVKRPLCSGSAIQPSSPLIKEIQGKICFSV